MFWVREVSNVERTTYLTLAEVGNWGFATSAAAGWLLKWVVMLRDIIKTVTLTNQVRPFEGEVVDESPRKLLALSEQVWLKPLRVDKLRGRH